MTFLTQETPAERRTDAPSRTASPARATIRNPLSRLRRLVPKKLHPFGWIAAERIATAQASLFRRLTREARLNDPVALVRALPNIRVRLDETLPRMSTRHWDPIVRRWIITLQNGLPEASHRFLILREFKHIIDHPDALRLYDADHERGPVQAEMAGDHFALCALMPANEVRRAVREGSTTIRELAHRFNAPEYRVSLRLSDLGLTKNIRPESKGGNPS